ncbi:MAG: hypothetical protein JST43_01045 [Bacteroidetes bacterium]|nr:hypothetical protein [Bacteroidota bacterium]MBS1540656.1 hypothetical protein [Bacteroidota bacterium]
MNELPKDFNGQPPILIHKFVEIENDGIAIIGNRNTREDSAIHFYKIQLQESFLDSLNGIATKYEHDKHFLGQNPNGTFDGYYQPCLLIETRNKNVLIEYWGTYSIPDDLKPIVSVFLKLAEVKHPEEIKYPQINSIRKKLDSVLLQRSKMLPPPIKTIIKFLPPKVNSTGH